MCNLKYDKHKLEKHISKYNHGGFVPGASLCTWMNVTEHHLLSLFFVNTISFVSAIHS